MKQKVTMLKLCYWEDNYMVRGDLELQDLPRGAEFFIMQMTKTGLGIFKRQ